MNKPTVKLLNPEVGHELASILKAIRDKQRPYVKLGYARVNHFVDYMIEYYGEYSRVEILEALAVRLISSIHNENGKALNQIEFAGDSFDRGYVEDIITTMRDK